jgi:cell wall-associated NlpC family hydrolase
MSIWRSADAQSLDRDFVQDSARSSGFKRSYNLVASRPKIRSRDRSERRERQVEAEIEALLYEAIQDRLGVPYRSNGTDDRGYDCSGLVWRVFQEAGIDLTRTSARSLWEKLPKANEEEEMQFGTLVFFKGLNHVGIVRDPYSFYHASTSQGVVRSFYSGYWGDRVIGFRRVPLPKS